MERTPEYWAARRAWEKTENGQLLRRFVSAMNEGARIDEKLNFDQHVSQTTINRQRALELDAHDALARALGAEFASAPPSPAA